MEKFLKERKVNRSEVHWCCPRRFSQKLNLDDASKGNPNLVGMGCIIRDQGGHCVWVA